MAKISKKPEQQTFNLEVWYRFGNEEKEFENYSIKANSIEEAVEQAESKHRFIIGTYHNGVKVSPNRVNL
ncbi:hypothetical protein [Flavobacterium sp.]|uniref:hypothetical protein n=1 Tax=Flavobacterium sp. TaxID=239 RepID=UPI0025BFFF79|nr:hypothetical protein [Flavobacterium sp.]MBA4155043.1 hypothetical protein [Flavobacterium sp.]